MPLVVGLMYNLGKQEPPAEGEPPDAHAELDSEETVLAVATALAAAGHQVVWIEGNEQAFGRLREVRPDIVFNMCEGLRGESRESHIPAILDMLGIPYTGSGVLSLALALDKAAAKRAFAYHGVPTPRFRTIAPGQAADPGDLRFPLFVKPVREGSSMGIGPNSIVNTPAELADRVAALHRLYRQPALVEEYIQGREFTVGMVGNEPLHLFPMMEINFAPVPADHGHVYSRHFKVHWDAAEFYLCPAPVAPELEQAIKAVAMAAFRALGCRDVGRVDIRLGADGVPYVLEVNPLPGLTPDFSDLCRSAAVGGVDYQALVNSILAAAIARSGLPAPRDDRMAQSA